MPKGVSNIVRSPSYLAAARAKAEEKSARVGEELATLSNARLGALRVNIGVPPRPWARNKDEVLSMLGSFAGGEPGGAAIAGPTDSRAKIVQKHIGNLGYPFLAFNLTNRALTGRVASAVSGLSKMKLITTSSGYSQAAFNLATKPFTFVHGLWAAVVTTKKAYDIGYDVAADISRHKDRMALQKLIKDWDPVTGRFIAEDGMLYDSPEKMAQLRALSSKPNAWREDKWYGQKWRTNEGGNIWRTPGQRTLDILSAGKDVVGYATGAAIPNLTLFGAVAGSTAAVAGTVISSVGHGVIAANQTSRAVVQMTAMNNIEGARVAAKQKLASYQLSPGSVKAVATNQLIVAASNRMLQERTYAARLAWFNAFTYGLSSAITAAGLGTLGVGVIATNLISAVGLIASSGAAAVFGYKHGKTLSKRRAENAKVYEAQKRIIDSCSEETKRLYFKGLDNKESIGLIERFLLDNLRGESAENAKEAYDFFRACGVSSNTIKAMMLQPADRALSTMQAHMYSNRTKFMAKNVKYSMETMGYLSGVTYAKRAYRAYRAQATQLPALGDVVVTPLPSRPQTPNLPPPGGFGEDDDLDDLEEMAPLEIPAQPRNEVKVLPSKRGPYRY